MPGWLHPDTADAELVEVFEMGFERVRHLCADLCAGAKQVLDAVEMAAATRALLCSGTAVSPSPSISVTALVSTSNPASPRDTSLATMRSIPLRARLSRARATASAVSAAKPTSI